MTKRFRIIAPALVALVVLLAGSAFIARASSHDETFYACLYAGSLSQVNTNGYPANCGRGTQVSWVGSITPADIQQHIYKAESDVVQYRTANPPTNGIMQGEARCEAGDTVVGGGYRIIGANLDATVWRFFHYNGSNRPSLDNGGWWVAGRNPQNASGSLADTDMIVYAMCVGTPAP